MMMAQFMSDDKPGLTAISHGLTHWAHHYLQCPSQQFVLENCHGTLV